MVLNLGSGSTQLASELFQRKFGSVKFVLAMLVYLAGGVVLGLGILQTVQGRPALLIAGMITYILMLGLIGCRTPKASSH